MGRGWCNLSADPCNNAACAAGQGSPRQHMLRQVMNGIRYVLRYGIPWDAMPKDLPPSSIRYD
jgi:putative transposase